MDNRNDFIISKGFRSYFKTLIIALVGEQVCLTFNMIFAGQFVSADAFAALDLAIPVEGLMNGILLLMIGGAAAPASRYVGNQEFSRAHKTLTSSMLVASLVALVLSILSIFNIDAIVGFLCDNEVLAPYLKDYLFVYFLLFVPMTVSTALVQMINIDGKPNVATIAVIVASVVDIALDVVLLKGFRMGVAAVAWSDLLAYVLMILIILPFLLDKRSQFRFVPAGSQILEIQKEITASGVSYCLPNIAISLLVFIVNSAVLYYIGTDALFVFSVGYQILSLVVMFMNCIGGTVLLTMGSMFVGCGEMNSLRFLANRCFRVCLVAVVLLVGLAGIFPDETMYLFGNEPIAGSREITWLRMTLFFAIPYTICSFKSYLAQTYGKAWGSIMPFLIFISFFVLLFFASVRFRPELMFASMAASGALYLIVDAVYSVVQRMKSPRKSFYLLIPKDENKHSLFRSVPYTNEGLEMVLMDVAGFLETCNISASLCGGINICCEELAMNIIEKNRDKGEDDYFFDIFILDEDETIKVSIKDAGQPFNPVKKYEGTAADALAAGEDMDLSLRLVNVLCKTLTYNYMFGQNAIYMSFEKK